VPHVSSKPRLYHVQDNWQQFMENSSLLRVLCGGLLQANN